MIKIYEPYINEKTKKYAYQAIDSGWISSQGEFIEKATEKLSSILGTENLFLVSNGTTGMHCVAKAINLKYEQVDTIIVPNNSYVAAWNSFLYDKKFKLISVDSDLSTWNYNLQELDELLTKVNFEKTALLCVHNLGNIINVERIKKKYPQLLIIEDNCEGLFGKYNGKYSGTSSFASAVSFFANKTITSGEGGAVIINDEDTKKYLKSFINQGNTNKRFVHDKIAQNYRMTNIQAAILFGQLESLNEIAEKKTVLFETYRNAFKNCKSILFQESEENTLPSNWMFGVRFVNSINYESAFSYLQKNNIDCRPMFYSYEEHKFLENLIFPYKKNDNANIINKSAIILPSHPSLKNEEIKHIIKIVKELASI